VEFSSGDNSAAFGVAQRPGGGYVVAGRRRAETDANAPNDFALAGLQPGGDLDPAFGGGDASVEVDFGAAEGERVGQVLVQRDARIVLAGAMFNPDNFALARLLPSGRLDSTFDRDGRVTTDFGTHPPIFTSEGAYAATRRSPRTSRGTPTSAAASRFSPTGGSWRADGP
jgi:Domain of unknown function (DUF5122) beta-propeller